MHVLCLKRARREAWGARRVVADVQQEESATVHTAVALCAHASIHVKEAASTLVLPHSQRCPSSPHDMLTSLCIAIATRRIQRDKNGADQLITVPQWGRLV